MQIHRLRAVGVGFGREGMSKMALSCVESCDGSYKGVMQLCGELSIIAKMAGCDEYWNEQVSRGKNRINEVCEYKLEQIGE